MNMHGLLHPCHKLYPMPDQKDVCMSAMLVDQHNEMFLDNKYYLISPFRTVRYGLGN